MNYNTYNDGPSAGAYYTFDNEILSNLDGEVVLEKCLSGEVNCHGGFNETKNPSSYLDYDAMMRQDLEELSQDNSLFALNSQSLNYNSIENLRSSESQNEIASIPPKPEVFNETSTQFLEISKAGIIQLRIDEHISADFGSEARASASTSGADLPIRNQSVSQDSQMHGQECIESLSVSPQIDVLESSQGKSEKEIVVKATGPNQRDLVKPVGHSLTEQYWRALQPISDFTIDPKKVADPHKKSRGRPETKIDMSKQALKKLIDKIAQDLVKKMKEKNQRSDARTATICRHIAKIPDHFLKELGSKCRFKSNDLSEFLSSYLKSFVGFLNYYNVSKQSDPVYIQRLFFDFIMLRFPENKVMALISSFEQEGFLLDRDVSYYSSIFSQRKSAAKKNFKSCFQNNSAFQILIKSVNKLLKGYGEASECIIRVLNDLMTPQ